MQNLKFRAFDHFNAEYFYSENYGMVAFWRSVNDRIEGGNKVTVEQLTGLLDKNGKEIYEGDILGDILMLPVAWCDACGGWQLVMQEYGCMNCEGDISWLEVVEDQNRREVIGNIHENPELLNT